MQAGDIVAAIDLGTSRTAYAYTVVGREHIWLGVPDSPDDDRNVSSVLSLTSTSRGVRYQLLGDHTINLYVNLYVFSFQPSVWSLLGVLRKQWNIRLELTQ